MLVFTLKYEVLELTNMILLKSATLVDTNYFYVKRLWHWLLVVLAPQ